MQFASALLFLGFVAVALLAATHKRSPRYRSFVNLLLVYAACAGLAAGLLHREAWPFSRWLVFAYPEVPHSTLHLRAYDRSGVEYELDARALEPFNPIELYTWLSVTFPRLPAAQQDEAAGHLLLLANASRRRVLEGGSIGIFARYFGSAAAPTHFLFTRKWDGRAALPKESFLGLRIYEDSWDIEQRYRDPHAFQRRLLYQFPRAQ